MRETKGMIYRVTVEAYNPITGEVTHKEYRANSLIEAQMIEHETDPTNALERRVRVEPDVLAYLELHYPGHLQRLWPDSH